MACCSAAHAQWIPFEWSEHEVAGASTNKAVILFPVALDGKRCMMQLDTGAGEIPARYRQRRF